MWIMPQLALQKILQTGLRRIKDNPALLDDIFGYMCEPTIAEDYGPSHVAEIKAWFLRTKIPVLHAWTFNAERIPCISIHLSGESEDESKVAVGDYYGDDENGDVGTTPIVSQLDVGILGTKNSDEVLWLYYIATYILFNSKLLAEQLGLKLQTFTASDWERRQEYAQENVWIRWIRFRCITQNFWSSEEAVEFDDVESMVDVESASF